jgi:hypothetical protein
MFVLVVRIPCPAFIDYFQLCTFCFNELIFVMAFSLFMELTALILFTVLNSNDYSERFHVDMNRRCILFCCLYVWCVYM